MAVTGVWRRCVVEVERCYLVWLGLQTERWSWRKIVAQMEA
jgi:hypothetical protein